MNISSLFFWGGGYPQALSAKFRLSSASHFKKKKNSANFYKYMGTVEKFFVDQNNIVNNKLMKLPASW